MPGHKTCTGAVYNDRIYEIDKIGYPAHALSSAATNDSQPVWSADRSRFVFVRERPSGVGYDLWLMNANASGQKRQIVFRGNSPDGQTFDLGSPDSRVFGLRVWLYKKKRGIK